MFSSPEQLQLVRHSRRFGRLCTSLHKCPYAQCPVMNSFGSLVAAFTVKSRI
jgi:hypothetical protein